MAVCIGEHWAQEHHQFPKLQCLYFCLCIICCTLFSVHLQSTAGKVSATQTLYAVNKPVLVQGYDLEMYIPIKLALMATPFCGHWSYTLYLVLFWLRDNYEKCSDWNHVYSDHSWRLSKSPSDCCLMRVLLFLNFHKGDSDCKITTSYRVTIN